MNIVANTVQPQGTPRNGLLTRHPLLLYFILAYAGSWLLALPYVRFADGAGLLPFRWPVPFVVSAAVIPFAGPFLAAFIVTGLTEGRAGIRRLVGRIVLWRVGLRWYLFALVGIPLITVLGAIVLPGVLGSFRAPAPSWVLTYSISFVIAFFIGGPLGEEPGWRGFALPRLQQRIRSYWSELSSWGLSMFCGTYRIFLFRNGAQPGTLSSKLAAMCSPESPLRSSTRGSSTVQKAACFSLSWRTPPLTPLIQVSSFSLP